MKKCLMVLSLVLIAFSVALAADLTGNVVDTDIPEKKRYQFYSTLGTYTAIEMNLKRDLGRNGGLGYIHNKGAQVIELLPNYADDSLETMNPITVPALAVWNPSPNNLEFETFRIRSTTAATLTVDVLFH